MREKRRHPRIELDLPVILRCKGRLIPATAVNVSCGGMFISAEGVDISGGNNVEVIFDLDSANKDMSLRGRILRTESSGESSGVGIEFSNAFSPSHRVLLEYISKNLN